LVLVSVLVPNISGTENPILVLQKHKFAWLACSHGVHGETDLEGMDYMEECLGYVELSLPMKLRVC
jgi:hypothetical protein